MRRIGRQLGDAEVEDLCHACAGEEDVFRLEVAMHQARCVRGDQASGDVGPNLPRHGGRQRIPIEPGPQRLTFEQLDDDVRVALEEADVVHLHDIGMIDRCGDARFTKKALDMQLVGRSRSATAFSRRRRGEAECRSRGRQRPSRRGRSD